LIGAGKYDHLATHVREASKAEAVIVIVLNGDQGSGFSVQATRDITPQLVGLLRRVADDIEADVRQ
jgi:hypothetical protein